MHRWNLVRNAIFSVIDFIFNDYLTFQNHSKEDLNQQRDFNYNSIHFVLLILLWVNEVNTDDNKKIESWIETKSIQNWIHVLNNKRNSNWKVIKHLLLYSKGHKRNLCELIVRNCMFYWFDLRVSESTEPNRTERLGFGESSSICIHCLMHEWLWNKNVMNWCVRWLNRERETHTHTLEWSHIESAYMYIVNARITHLSKYCMHLTKR